MELGGWDSRGWLGYVYAISRRRDGVQELLVKLLEEAETEVVPACNIARIYLLVQLGSNA
jgi:hypothetical protein